MVKNKRAKGARLEYEVRDNLIKEGYFVVRQASSAFPDLIAIKKDEVIFCECKWNKYLSKREKSLLLKYNEQLGVRSYVCYYIKLKYVKGRRKTLQMDEVI